MDTVTPSDTPLLRALRGLSSEELQEELAEIQRQKSALETHESLVQLALLWKKVVNSDQPQEVRRSADAPKPHTREAILAVMSERPGRWLKSDLVRELERRDWMPGGKYARGQVTSRLGEMVKRGELIRYAPGEYSLAALELGKPPS
jgi:hypothetical protein